MADSEKGEHRDSVSLFGDEPQDLRPGSDACYKCSVCDTDCPVAAVDDEFPGPKFQGPEQWRLRRKEDVDIDSSIMSCSNCMRCDRACPSGVPLSRMHNEARGLYVEQSMSWLSRVYWRNRLLSNYGLLARIAARVPRLANTTLNNRIVQWLNEQVLGITAERDFPAFAQQTFRAWWDEQGGDEASRGRAEARREELGLSMDADKRIAYFHGDYANYNTVEVAKAMVNVYEAFGYEIIVPQQRCSGTPMFANGMLDDAERAAKVNARELSSAVRDGYDVICSCTSCSMALRQEYPELFDLDGVNQVAGSTYEALEYLRIHEDLTEVLAAASIPDEALAYHAPCHARNQGLAGQPVELFEALDGVTVDDVGPSCSGISGTYGWKREKYETSMAIGKPMFDHMREATGETGLTECPTCAMQMEHGTEYPVRHPLEIIERAIVETEDDPVMAQF